MNESQYRNRWLRRHKQYERIAYKQLIEGFKSVGNSVPFSLITSTNYNDILNSNLNQEQFFNIYHNIYRDIGVIHGKRIGREINQQTKDFTFNSFLSLFERELINWLLQNVMKRVVTVRRTYLENMRTIITNGLNEGKTIVEISKDLQTKINQRGFYRWQALRIARTETTAAANYAALQSGISSRIIMDKVWISATDSRTRTLKKDKYDHLAMNGKRVPQNEDFKVPTKGGFENMAFAGDPKGKAGNVINCRCANALVPRRDKDGNLVRF